MCFEQINDDDDDDINNPKPGTQTRNNFRVPEIHFVNPIVSDVDKLVEFNDEIMIIIIFLIRTKMAEISPENSVHGRVQDKLKRLSPETSSCRLEMMLVVNTALWFQL